MSKQLIPVIVCGGSGSRLWPVSRQGFPKPFHPWLGEETLFQQTIRRACALCQTAPVVITHADYQFIVQEQAQAIQLPLSQIITEPQAKNTAPAIAIAAHAVAAMDTDSGFLVMPADHSISDTMPLRKKMDAVADAVEAGYLLTFGIEPRTPHTGYGYIQQGEPLNDGVHRVERFCEKPSLAEAEQFIQSGDYLWNSGMFAMMPDVYLSELEKFQPAMAKQCRAAWTMRSTTGTVQQLAAEQWAACEAESIDYAVMELSKRVAVMPCALDWSDIGSWSSLAEHWVPDQAGNVCRGHVVQNDSQNNIVMSQKRMITTVGVKDHIVVETADAVLVAHKDHDQGIKQLVGRLLEDECVEAVMHPLVHRPWGHFETVMEWPGYKVKRIRVNPGASLSLQRHRHRSEHWVVVKGVAAVRVGDECQQLLAGESVDIPVQTLHRLTNESKAPLEIVEIQLGAYLGEDDIERFDDVYGRSDVAEEASNV